MMLGIPDILADVDKSLTAEAKILPHRSNWASLLGNKCLRQLVYYRTDWDKQTLPDPKLQGIFNTGTKLERVVKNILNEIGRTAKPQWELVDTGIQLNDRFLRDHEIGGEPDTFLKVWFSDRPRIMGPVEVKTCSPTIFTHLDGLDSLTRYSWMRGYRCQLTIYEIGSNFETGWFLFCNKGNLWDYKLIELPLDYQFAEELTVKADAINKHIQNGTQPDKMSDPDECPKCPFQSLCMPDLKSDGNLKVVDHEELQAILDRMGELDEVASEYKELEKARDKLLIKGQNIVCGSWLVRWKEIVKHFRAQEAKPASERAEWHKSIVKIKS